MGSDVCGIFGMKKRGSKWTSAIKKLAKNSQGEHNHCEYHVREGLGKASAFKQTLSLKHSESEVEGKVKSTSQVQFFSIDLIFQLDL